MKRSLPTLLTTVYSLAVILLGGVPFVANASITEFYQEGFKLNGNTNDIYYAHSDDQVSFGVRVNDVAASRFNVYGCVAFAGSCVLKWTSPTVNLSSTSMATSTMNFGTFVANRPFAGTYIAVQVYNAGGTYLTEYPIGSAYLKSGYVVDEAVTDLEALDFVSKTGFYAIVLFFISLVITIWMFRQLMR